MAVSGIFKNNTDFFFWSKSYSMCSIVPAWSLSLGRLQGPQMEVP